MVPQKYRYFFRRLWQLGPYKVLWLSYHRIKKQLFINHYKKRLAQGKSFHTWKEIAKKNNLHNFDLFFSDLKAKNFCELIWQQLPQQKPEQIFKNADNAATPTITMLGFGQFTFSLETIPWHQDFTQANPSPSQWKDALYADISINTALHQEIKVPWELSRLQHLFALGVGYHHAQQTNDHERATRYARSFQAQISSWMKNNPYLRGVNWLNPMEVAIRGINLVWAFHFFKDEPTITPAWWQDYICMLYDHTHYLEHNWEVSDKPNNHYISDLVGYLYLSSLLVDIKKIYQTRTHVIQNLITQFKYQTLPDRTSYEGSTNYHALVTELLGHTLLLCKSTHILIPTFMYTLYDHMLSFLSDCSDHSGMLVQIGDNDGGHILIQPLWQTTHQHHDFVKTYQYFGITIISHNDLFITFRHPTYQNKQPSGHFHYDQLAITLSIAGIPIFIDPGTYRYTSDPTTRNYFRSFAAHNTFFLTQSQQNALPRDLFQLHRAYHNVATTPQRFMLHDYHEQYLSEGLLAHRQITWQREKLHITDWWEQTNTDHTKKHATTWTLHCGHDIVLEKKDDYHWIIKKEEREICCIETTHIFDLKEAVYSPAYGSKISTKMLIASTIVGCDKQHIVIQKAKEF